MSDQRYRQRGYKDEDRGESRGQRKKPPQERREGPRGRGLGAPTDEVFRCGNCHGKVLARPRAKDFDAVCPRCSKDLHACINCSHFDTGARFECRQPITERVAKKRAKNSCELFHPKTTVEFAKNETLDPEEARAEFDALFGDL